MRVEFCKTVELCKRLLVAGLLMAAGPAAGYAQTPGAKSRAKCLTETPVTGSGMVIEWRNICNLQFLEMRDAGTVCQILYFAAKSSGTFHPEAESRRRRQGKPGGTPVRARRPHRLHG